MAAGYDIGASLATSSGATGGTAGTGDVIIGGSGGVNKVPLVFWVVLAVFGILMLFKVLFPSKRRR
jgi:hypothetical protein